MIGPIVFFVITVGLGGVITILYKKYGESKWKKWSRNPPSEKEVRKESLELQYQLNKIKEELNNLTQKNIVTQRDIDNIFQKFQNISKGISDAMNFFNKNPLLFNSEFAERVITSLNEMANSLNKIQNENISVNTKSFAEKIDEEKRGVESKKRGVESKKRGVESKKRGVESKKRKRSI